MKLTFLFIILTFQQMAFSQVDPNASIETKNLFKRLTKISLEYKNQQEIFLGQQNAFNEGRGWRHNNQNLGSLLQSDMSKASGVHPIVYGLDFSEIGDWNSEFLRERILLSHERGGVFTLSWHMRAFVDDKVGNGQYNDRSTKVVSRILPGGDHHSVYIKELDRLVDFLKSISNVPVIFRPFHEHNWSIFWWGKNLCTSEEYIAIWKFTINYLRKAGINNILTAYSPINVGDDYFDRYPGDDYVDILGVDMYFRNKLFDLFEHSMISPLEHWKKSVIKLMQFASKRKKIPAITEFGQEGIWYSNFWTDYFGWPLNKEGILQHLSESSLPSRGIAYIMLWRNDPSDPKHFYGPFPGHNQNNNFELMLSSGIFKGIQEN